VYAYSLTFCAFSRSERFRTPGIIEMLVRAILTAALEFEFDVLAYCVMPDHVHLLVQGMTASAALRPFVASVKQRSGYEFKRRTGQRLWQKGYYERTLRRDEDLLTVARYIEANPVRAALVPSIGVWLHVGGRLLIDPAADAGVGPRPRPG
jgi:REP-associated tyrosine transposase